MRRLAVFLLCSTSGAAGVLLACSSDDATPVPADAAIEAEASAPEARAPTGLDPRPGKVQCGASECTILAGNVDAASICCEQPDGSAECQTPQINTCAAQGWRITCDEPSDCPADFPACCFTVTESGGVVFGASSCQASCFQSQTTLCRVDDTCDGGSCQAVACGIEDFHVCEKPALCK